MPIIVQLFSTLGMKLKQIFCKITCFHAQQYRIVFNLGHEIKTIHLWNNVIVCLALHNCFQPWAWNQSNLYVKSCDFMPSSTELFSTLSMKTKQIVCEITWFHAHHSTIVFNLGNEIKLFFLWNNFLAWMLEIVDFEDF